MIDFLSILGSHLGSKTEPERVHKGLLAQVGLPGGPRGSPGVDVWWISITFCEHCGVFMVAFWEWFRACGLVFLQCFFMCWFSFQHGMSALSWHQMQLLFSMFDVVEAAPQARPKTTWRACNCSKTHGTIDLIAVTLMPSWCIIAWSTLTISSVLTQSLGIRFAQCSNI